MAVDVTLTLNGQQITQNVEPRLLLSDFLRHRCQLTSVHVGCEQGVCGACTVLIDGEPARSCLTLAVMAQGRELTTVEGLSGPVMDALQAAFQRHHALQCGYCTPAMLLTAHRLLGTGGELEEGYVREALSGNLCRCTGYQAIAEAVADVSRIAGAEGGLRNG